MTTRKLLAIGGIFASLVLVVAGIASMFIGYQGRQEVRSTLAQEKIIGPDDSRIPGQLVDTGAKARAQADTIREHQLKSSNGLTYAEMGRFATPDGDPKGTNVADQAAKDANGKPIPNGVRASWVTATALSTSLNTAYFAEQVGLFSMVMGAALLLTGIGFAVLTAAALLHVQRLEESETAPATGGMVSKPAKS
jgi:hypothetical protein